VKVSILFEDTCNGSVVRTAQSCTITNGTCDVFSSAVVDYCR